MDSLGFGVGHGGNLAEARRRFGTPEGGWIDLSTGINPNPYPVTAIDLESFSRLPDPERLERLREAAWRAYGAGEHAAIAVAPGTQAIIDRLPQIGGGRARVAVVGPTYAEHARVWTRDGHDVTTVTSLPDAIDFDVVVVVNPNNPDGRLFARADLMALADDLGMSGGLLIMDEAFADVTPGRSLVDEAGHRALLILRSFGKFFGLAGIRLGFAIGSERLIRRLEDLLGPWPVSGPALDIGIEALGNSGWIAETGRRLVDQTSQLDDILEAGNLSVAGGTALFRLVETQHAIAIHHKLARSGIWTRVFEDNPRWLRLGLPKDASAFRRLESILATDARGSIMHHEHVAD